jgi:hypothetical protein
MEHTACTGRWEKSMYKIILKPEEKRLFGRPRRRWEDDVRYEVLNGFSWLRTGSRGGFL